MKKYFCLLIACASLLFASAQNRVDSLQLLYKKKAFKEALLFCEKYNIPEKGEGRELYYAGLIYLENNKICESQRLLNNAIGYLDLSKKENKKALKILKKYKVFYDSTLYFYSKAYDAHQNENFTQALDFLQLVLKRDPRFLDALQFRLILAVEFKDENDIEKYFELVKKENPYYVKCYKTAGTYNLDNEKYEKSLLIFNELTKLDEASGYFQLGTTYYEMEDYEKAMMYYRKSYALDREKAAFFNIGLCYENLKQYDLALQTFLNLKKSNYENIRLNEQIGDCYYNLDKLSEALTHYKLAIIDQPKKAENYRKAGMCNYNSEIQDWTREKEAEKYKNVVIYLKKALELNPTDTRLHFYLAFSMNNENDYQEGLKIVEDGLKIDSLDYDLWHAINSLAIHAKNGTKLQRTYSRRGIDIFKRQLLLEPNKGVLHYNLGRCYDDFGENLKFESRKKYEDSAIVEMKIALQLDSTHEYFFENITPMLEFASESVKYEKDLEVIQDQWYRLFPNNPDAMAERVRKVIALKMYAEANEIYIRANNLKSDSWKIQQINSLVRDNKDKYQWSDICEKKECKYWW